MNILVTGSKGFLGKNLIKFLKKYGHNIIEYDLGNDISLEKCIEKCDFVVHLAGIMRPLNEEFFYKVNTDLTFNLIKILKKQEKKIPLLLSSSIQVLRDNAYGKSKLLAENLVLKYNKDTGSHVYIYRLNNIFGGGAKINSSSVVATFCYNISHNLEIFINSSAPAIDFIYIDDVCENFLKAIHGEKKDDKYLTIKPKYNIKIDQLASKIYEFKSKKRVLNLNEFDKKLYKTYLDYSKMN